MNKITKIELQKRNKNRVNIYMDEEYRFSCDNELVYRHNLYKGQEIEEEYLETLIKDDEFIKGKTAALKLVEKSYKTEKELEDRLLLKGFTPETISKVKDKLKEYDFINDEKYVKAYIKDNIKKQGEKKILYNLSRKGINGDLIRRELDNIDKKELFDNALLLGKKKYAQLIKREEDKFKIANKLVSYLLSRGYDYETARDTTRKIVDVT